MTETTAQAIPESVNNYLSTMDDYDDPCFVLIHSEQDLSPHFKVISKIVENAEPYETHELAINDNLYFLSLDCTHPTMAKIADEILATLNKHSITAHLAIFRHNCLGEAEETFDWCQQLLEETIQEFGAESGYKVNDFKDRGNWPGISKYMDA